MIYISSPKKQSLAIPNQYIDLKPVLRRLAAQEGIEAIVVNSPGNPETSAAPAEWVLLATNFESLNGSPIRGAGNALPGTPDVRMWTDDYSSLFRLLK